MKTLLVTGGNGQLARALAALAPRFAELGFGLQKIGRPQFDFSRPETIDACFLEAQPALVINAAGWTAVDAAEAQPKAAAQANDSGPARLGAACVAANIAYIHISTDYVFDGTKGQPYVETDEPNPINVYGATKLAGERKILATGGRAVILRTSWLYSAEGTNFVRTMLAASQKTDTLRVVADQHGCPTSAEDLAAVILAVVDRIAAGWREFYGGIFHAAGSSDATWHGFAEATFAHAARLGCRMPAILPIRTAEWPTAARRPADSRLACAKLTATFGVQISEWRTTLGRVIEEIWRNKASAARV